MEYAESLQIVLDYIEENLYEDMDLNSLASVAGYSKYHFLRVFKEAFLMTPSEYVRRRRITESACDIADTAESISQIGYKHGFNSKENFTRAFKSEHRILPSDYRLVDNSLKLLHRNKLEGDGFVLVPRMVELKPFCATVYKCDEAEPAKFWNKYNCGGFSGILSGGEAQPDYGFSVWNYEKGKLDYYIGILSEYAKGDISGTIQLNVEGGWYAVFDTPKANKYTFVNTIHRTWNYINSEWNCQREFVRLGDCDFETYRESSREFSEQIYIHVKRNIKTVSE